MEEKQTTTWWHASIYSRHPEPIEVIRATEKCIYTKDLFSKKKERRRNIEASWEKYFPCFEDAQAYLDSIKNDASQKEKQEQIRKAAPELLDALLHLIKQAPELATVPGIAAAIEKATGKP